MSDLDRSAGDDDWQVANCFVVLKEAGRFGRLVLAEVLGPTIAYRLVEQPDRDGEGSLSVAHIDLVLDAVATAKDVLILDRPSVDGDVLVRRSLVEA